MTLKIKDPVFLRSVTNLTQAPEALPAVAFAGRSNVGKSSLLNKLLGGRKLARTSSIPGCTQLLNYFGIDGLYHFIDLPGYGYAKAPRKEQVKWAPMIEHFFLGAKALRLVVLLVDVRRDPSPEDLSMVNWLEAAKRPFIFAVTKIDKVTRNERHRRLIALQKAFGLDDATALIPVSAHTGEGMDDLLDVIEEVLAVAAPDQEP